MDWFLDNFGHFLTFLYLLLFTFFLIPEIKNSYMLNKVIKILFKLQNIERSDVVSQFLS